MARPGGPWWWTARRRWAATVGGKRAVAPPEVAKGDKAAARRWYEAAVAEAAAPRSAATFADLCNLYLARLATRVARDDYGADTLRARTADLTSLCKAKVGGLRLGSVPLAAIDARTPAAVVADLAGRRGVRPGSTLSPSRLAGLADALRAALRWGVRPDDGRDPLVAVDPTIGWRPPASRPAEVRIKGRADAARWLRWCRVDAGRDPVRRDLARLQRVLIATGARPAEAATATWREIEWDAARTASGATCAVLVRARWKNARRTGRLRRIVLPPAIRGMLGRLKARTDPDPDAPIFRAAAGGWTADASAKAVARVRARARRAGVDLGGLEGEGPDRARGYLWRHCAASRMLAAGIDVATVAEALGTSVAMVSRTYAHADPSRVVAAAVALTADRRPRRRDA